MRTTEEPAAELREAVGRPATDETARARAYLDLWERHLTQSALDGPILPGFRLPA